MTPLAAASILLLTGTPSAAPSGASGEGEGTEVIAESGEGREETAGVGEDGAPVGPVGARSGSPAEEEGGEGIAEEAGEAGETGDVGEDDAPVGPVGTMPEYVSEVRAEALPRTASSRRIGTAELEAAPRRATEDLFRQVPGLLVVQHGAEGKGHQFFLRGFDAVHGMDLEVRVAGMPVNEVSNVHAHGYLDLYFVPPEAVETLAVRKGPFDLDQGNFATAGTLDLDLGIAPAERGARLAYEGGSTNRHRVVTSWAPEDAEDFVVGEALTDDGFGDDRWSRRVAWLGRLDGAHLGDGPDVVLGWHVGRHGSPNAVRREDVESGELGSLETYTHGLEGRSAHALALADWRLGDARALRLLAGTMLRSFRLEANYTGWLQDADRGDFHRQSHDALTGFASAWWTPRFPFCGRSWTGQLGLEWRGDGFRQEDAPFDPVTARRFDPERSATGQVHQATLAAGVTGSAASWFRFAAGVRGDLFGIRFTDRVAGGTPSDGIAGAVSPRLSLQFPLPEEWTLFAAYGRGLRSPEARAVAAGGQPSRDVPLEAYRGGPASVAASDSVEVGVRGEPWPWLEVAVAGFATFLENEMVFDHVSNTNVELNATRRLGADLSVRVRPLPWLRVSLDLTGGDARFVESGNPVPGAPRFLVGFAIAMAHPIGIRAALSGYYLAPRPLAHGAVGTHQATVDLTAAYRWRWFELRLDVENLFDLDGPEGQYHFASWFDRDEPRSAIPVTHDTPASPLQVRLGMVFHG